MWPAMHIDGCLSPAQRQQQLLAAHPQDISRQDEEHGWVTDAVPWPPAGQAQQLHSRSC
jgi:hypothetical protein